VNYNKKLPAFSMESYFSNKVTALGYMTFFYPHKTIKDIKIFFSGKFHNNTLTLKENYTDNDSKVLRTWSFKKTSSSCYIGKESNVKGIIKVSIYDNKLNMKYKFKTSYKKIYFSVNVKDSMYLVDKETLINKTIVSKYGITLAESFLVYKKL
jgi:virulence-associated protein VapD